jgi:hypothetical protein
MLTVSCALLLSVRNACCRLQYHVAVAARSNKQWDAIPRFIEGAGSSSIDGASNKRASAVSVINNQSKEAFYARLAQTPLSALPYCRQRVTIVFRETANSGTGECIHLAVTLHHCIFARSSCLYSNCARGSVVIELCGDPQVSLCYARLLVSCSRLWIMYCTTCSSVCAGGVRGNKLLPAANGNR